MVRMKENVIDKMETQSRMSRFAIVPILRGGMKSAVSDRIAEILRKSNFCSTNPVIKRLIIHNVQAYCIVIETSGTQSLRIICASVPYLLSLLSKANPKFKQMLEDEKVAEYINFFREADMESLLTSLSTATVIIQKGLEMCYPTLCVTLSRDALLLGKETWKYLMKVLRNGLISVFHFVMEDLGPLLHSICAQNHDIVKYLTQNLPAFAFAGAKGLVIFSFLLRRIVHAGLRSLKRFVTDLKFALLEKSIDFSMHEVLKQLYVSVKHFAAFIVSGSLFHYFKYMCEYVKLQYLPASKNILLALWNTSVEYVKYSAPFFKKLIRYIIKSVSCIFDESNLRNFVNFIYNVKPTFNSFLIKIEPYYQKLYHLVLRLGTLIIEFGHFVLPYTQKAASHLYRTLIRCTVFLIQHSLTLYNAAREFLYHLQQVYPTLKNSFLKIFQAIIVVLRTLFKYILRFVPFVSGKLQNCVMIVHSKIYPHLYPVVCELNSTVANVSSEIVQNSYHGMKRAVPSIWHAVKTVTPHSMYAINEFLVSSKNSVVVMYPSLRKAAVAIHPEVYRSLTVVLEDGNKVLVEVATVSYTASCHLGGAVKEISHHLPVVFCAIDEVAVSTFSATSEVLNTSLKAQLRVLGDLKKAGVLVGTSIKSVEQELASTLNDVILEVNCIISDNPEVQYFYLSLTEEGGQISMLTDKLNYFCYLNFLATKSAFGLLRKFYTIFTKYFSISGDDDSTYNFFYTVLRKITDYFKCEDSAKLAYESVMGVISSFVYCAITFVQQNTSLACSELHEIIVPNLWKYLKNAVYKLWKTQCDITEELWTFMEQMSIIIWKLICDNSPHAWCAFKDLCQKMWLLTCEISPGVWEFILSTAPVFWDSNRHVIQCVWKVYLQTCSQMWNAVVPLSSEAWECALDISPKVWLTVSENSKLHWQIFCSTAETSYDTVTDISASSWDILNKLISNSWNYAFRPATLSACSSTSSIVAKSIKLSYITYTRTGKFLLLCIELPGKKFPSMKLEEISSKIGERASTTRDIFKKCVTFSNENFLKPGSKRKLMYNAIKEVSTLSSRVTGWYLDCFKVESICNNLLKMYKIPFMPVSQSYALGQELLKKYSTFICLQDNLVFATYESDM